MSEPADGVPTWPWLCARRNRAGAASLVLLGAVLAPVRQHWRATPGDGFPLSSYPMFTARRAATGTVTHLVGLDRAGQRRLLPSSVAGPGRLNQVRRQLWRAVRSGRAAEACRAVADRLAQHPGARFADVVEVRVVTGTYRLDDYFAGRTEPVAERVDAGCPVVRR